MRILYVTTTFPVPSETFLQREARAMRGAGAELILLSLHKGGSSFDGLPIRRFSKWTLFRLLYLLPATLFRCGDRLGDIARALTHCRVGSFLNLMENLLALGAAIVEEDWIRRQRPDIMHCVWGSAPAAFGLLASRLAGVPFSMGAHAYDVYEHGGDCLLETKLRAARLIHVSTDMVAERLGRKGFKAKIIRIRRGLVALPPCRPLRRDRSRLRLLCVARLVEKKGLLLQLEIYRALVEAGIPFEARIVGEGPMRPVLESGILRLELVGQVSLLGRLDEAETQAQYGWADALLHTGVIAASGDRDGLPNVLPEAMAAGVIVLASPVSGVGEAVEDGVTGFLQDPRRPELWVQRCRLLQSDEELCERLRVAARGWVEREFRAERNTRELLDRLGAALRRANSLE